MLGLMATQAKCRVRTQCEKLFTNFSGTLPPKRAAASLIIDDSKQYAILFGGFVYQDQK